MIVDKPQGKEGRVIAAVVGGKRKYYEVVDDDLYDSLASISPDTNSIAQQLLRIFSLPARMLRAGVTSLPAFGVANAQRDAFFTSLSYSLPVRSAAKGAIAGGTIGAATSEDDDRVAGFLQGAGLGLGAGSMGPHAKRIVGGVRHVFRNDDVYQAFLREGAAGTGFFIPDRKTARRLVTELRDDGFTVGDLRPDRLVRDVWDALQAVNRAVEEAPRVAKFADELARGRTPAEAAVGAREVSLDFSRGGSKTKEVRRLRAFWNPMIQGLDKLRSVLDPRKNPKGYAVGLAAMTAPSIALWSINHDDPSYWKRPLWERNLVWLVPVGKYESGETRFLRIPKPFEVGYLFGSLPERALDYLYQRDPERAMEALKQMAAQTFGDLAPIPTGAEPLIENQFNYDTFRQRPVVGYELQDLPAREQYTAETSSAAIGLSRAAELASLGLLEVSPEKIDHLIEGYTGTGGRAVNEAITTAARRVGLDDRPQAPARIRSQWARFVTQPGGFSSDDVSTMFRRFENGDQHRRQWERLLEAGDGERAEAYYQKHQDKIELVNELGGAVKEFRKLSRERRQIERDPSLHADEKREMIGSLALQATELAAVAVGRPIRGVDDPSFPGRRQPALAEDSALRPQVPERERQQDQRNLPAPPSQSGKSRWSRDYGFDGIPR